MKPPKIVFRAGKKLAGQALARNLYQSVVAALAELLFNGLDAANLRGVFPEITIVFWKKGEHPLSLNGPAISILDNGTGMTATAFAAYCLVGESVHVGRADIHGKHGLGKFAVFALMKDEDGTFHLITNINDGQGTWRWPIRSSDVLSNEGGIEAVEAKRLPGLPKDGPFTQIFIPNIDDGLEPDQLRKELSLILPLRKWKVTVQGKEVVRRKFTSQLVFETKEIAAFKGTVKLEFGTAEISSESDAVNLIDKDSGRIVGDLHTLPPTARKLLFPILLDARLIGQVFVSNLESKSSASRSGLNARYWSSSAGRALIDVLNTNGVALAKQLIDEDNTPQTGIMKNMDDVVKLFTQSFGAPTFVGVGPGGGTGGGGGGGGGGGTSRPKPGGDGPTKRFSIKIEHTTYTVHSFPTESKTPAAVRRDSIVINRQHHEVKRLEGKRSKTVVFEGIVQMLIEAHVGKTREMTSDGFAAVYDIKNILFKGN